MHFYSFRLYGIFGGLFSLTSSQTVSTEQGFVFSGKVDDVPTDWCSGLISSSVSETNDSFIPCGMQCLRTEECSRIFQETFPNGSTVCTLADGFVDWQPRDGISKTMYSIACTNSIQPAFNPKNCKDLRDVGNTCSGFYTIYPDSETPVNVYCDMHTDQGGWTVIQRRFDGSVDFYLTWNEYKNGFGTQSSYWLGNDWIHELTKDGTVELYIKLEDWSCERRFARYSSFKIENETDNYRLTVSGYSGTAGESFFFNNGQQFSTKDADNDSHASHCAVVHHRGGWWFSGCSMCDLNGLLYPQATYDPKSMHWGGFHGWTSLRSSVMMIRQA